MKTNRSNKKTKRSASHGFVLYSRFVYRRFNQAEVSSELFENEPPGTVVKYLEARSTSSLMFEITDGNSDDMFEVNPSTGIVVTKRPLDYEYKRMYNLTITATNMVRNAMMHLGLIGVVFQSTMPPLIIYFDR